MEDLEGPLDDLRGEHFHAREHRSEKNGTSPSVRRHRMGNSGNFPLISVIGASINHHYRFRLLPNESPVDGLPGSVGRRKPNRHGQGPQVYQDHGK